ncbi:MAG: FAD:protein FMN transferase [Devosia sp.]
MPTDTLTRPLQRIALNGATMGTRYSAVFYAGVTPNGLPQALQRSVDAVDDQMSTWKPQSDLMRFNRAALGSWVTVPHGLLHVVEAGLVVGRLTGGAFDLGVLDLVAAWGFNDTLGKPDRHRVANLAATSRRPAHDCLELDVTNRRMRKLGPVTLDLSGIAKGYGVDQLAETMLAFGIGDFLVSIDGEVRARGRKADGTAWRVAIEAPVAGRREAAGAIDLEDAALATSGDYRHAVDLDGSTFSHTMDPRTGRPLANGIHAVTVRAATCMQADAWATAVMVLGEGALPLVRRLGMEALIATD